MDLLDPYAAAGAGTKHKQIQDARDMYEVIAERAARTGTAIPDYEFLELIGKGSFGRVYKCKRNSTQETVAVKIIDVDDLDYNNEVEAKDEAISDFRKEVKTLKMLRDSNARNINYIQEAFDLHSQLWIVSDYCPGGSVHTLMKATTMPGLEENYIIPIARELAIALKYVHDAGVIHRDVKCGNVLISESGQVQLCDFGVAAVIETEVSKRSTIIGTPFWMPPEMIASDEMTVQQGYGTEVDCWAFGCTVYEMATGMPPNHKFHPSMLRTVLKAAPRLQGDEYSQGLRDFIAFCLEEKPQDRPKMHMILQHPYVANTSDQYPTNIVSQMIDRYVQWERKGGQRASLFNPMGAAAPQLAEQRDDNDTWNFSTTESFELDFAKRYSQIGIAETDFAAVSNGPLEITPALNSSTSSQMTPFEEVQEELRAKRGERSMGRLFDPSSQPYDYNTLMEDDEQPLSDLPLRNLSSDRAANRETLIDLDMGGSGLDVQPAFNFDFSDVPTLKAARPTTLSFAEPDDEEQDDFFDDQDTRRATKDWQFPLKLMPSENTSRRTQDWTFAMAQPLTAVADRRTQDWTFATAQPATAKNNRLTQDWSFANAEPLAPEPDAEPDFTFPPVNEQGLAPGFRPHLSRTATEPLGQYNDFLHPPLTSIPNTGLQSSNVRESTPMIDLDFEMDYTPQFDMDRGMQTQVTASSSPTTSMAGSTETSRNPFFLDEVEPEATKEEVKRSSHRQSRSEPQLLAPGNHHARLVHSRGPSTDSILRHSRDRGYSYSSTASSDVHSGSWPRDYNRRMEAHTRQQLLDGLHASAVQPRNSWARFAATDSFDDTDVETPMPSTGVTVPGIDDADFPLGSGLGPSSRIDAFNIDTDDNSIYGDLTLPGSRPRADTGGTTSTSTDYDSSRDEGSYSTFVRRSRLHSEFPRLRAPDSEVLADGADPEIVFQEMDRLFADLEAGLTVAAEMFQRRDRDILRGREEEEDNERQMASEGEDVML